MTYRDRYHQAYESHHAREYPSAYRNFGAPILTMPNTAKANGLTKYITNFLNWSGHRATRIQSQGQFVVERYNSRTVSTGFRTSQTRRGTADISSTIKIASGFGISVQWEVKVGKDRPSEYQISEQAKEIAAGGHYYFIKTPEDFLQIYDKLITL